MKSSNEKIKILHLPTSVGGNPQMLNHFMNLMGLDSHCWVLSQHPLGLCKGSDKFIYKTTDKFLIKEIKRFLSLKYLFFYKLVFFNFGSSLYTPFPKHRFSHQRGIKYLLFFIYSFYRKWMQIFEIAILRVRKIKVFVLYQGSDSRQHEYCKRNFSVRIPLYNNEISLKDYQMDEAKRLQIKLFDKISSQIYALNPDLMYVLPPRTKFLPYSHVNLEEWLPVYLGNEKRPLRVGHAPSNRNIKGTKTVIEVASKMKSSGFDFEFILIEGVNNSEAKKKYEEIDILVDQLFAGWYGGLAVELMALGKPVLSYLREEDFHFLPKEMPKDIPIINVNEFTLLEKLNELLSMPRNDLRNIGHRSRKYVEKWHDPQKVTNRILKDIYCEFPLKDE